MKHGLWHTTTDCFCQLPDPAVIYDLQLLQKLFICQLCKIVRHQTIHMLLQGTDCFHQGAFKIMADTHNLSGGFHLGGQRSLCSNKFIKWKPWDLNYTVIKHWLKACIGFASNGIQCIS